MPQGPSGPIITGANWGPMPNTAPADMSILGLQMAHILPLSCNQYFSPDAPAQASASPLAYYDRSRPSCLWSGEAAGTSPTGGATVGTLPAVACANSGGKSLRSSKNSALAGGFTVIVTCNISAGALALTTPYRVLFGKGTVGNANLMRLALEPTDNKWNLTVPSSTGALVAVLPNFAPAAGPHVIVLSIALDKTLKFYDNKSGTANYSTTLANVAGPYTEQWNLGGTPGSAIGWEGNIGPAFFVEADPLHGTTAYDAARIAAMSALGTAIGATIDLT